MVSDALVVGINSYQAEGLRNLQAPAEDAEAIANILEQHGEFNVTRLPEALTRDTKQPYVAKEIKVSLAQLEDALIQLFKPQGRNIPDTALFYFSGHGIRRTSGLTEGFLATSNVDQNERIYGLSLQWLRRLLQESPVRQQIIWLDCCHSGELLNFNEADPGDVGQARDRSFIAASREFEQAYEDLGDRYSVLTKVLLEGLDPSRCPQQWVTNISLVDFIDKNLKNATQRPIYSNFGAPINLTGTLTATETIKKTEATAEICPYKGLQYFDCDDADYFYGREELTDTLLNKIRQDNFLAILGASGSGKSSVLRAGLIHQLQLGHKLANSRDWQVPITIPGEHPLKRLAKLFVEPNLPQIDKAEQLGKAEGLLKQGAEGLRRLVQTAEASRIVLIIDQFEEVFTLCQDNEERAKFFQCILGALATTENKLCLILAMRVDFFGKCFEKDYGGLGKKIEENLITITAMTEGQLRKAIVEPAKRVNLMVEAELVEEILRDVKGSPGILPLVQYTLTEIWKRKTDNCLKLATYITLGRIGGTLNKRATEVYNAFNEAEKEAAKHIFISLTQLGKGTDATRRRVLKRDLITKKYPETVIDNAVKKLADEKLIVTSEQIAKDSQLSREAVVDVAHEALIKNWDLLGKWLDESRSNLLEQRKIENDAQEWQDSGNKSDYLLQGWRLKEARKFQKESSDKYSLSTLAEAFIKKSISKHRNNLFKFLIIPLIGTGIIGFLVYRQISIQAAWSALKEAEKDESPYRKNEALKTLNYWQVLKQANLQEMNLKKIQLSSANLDGASLDGANLSGANLSESHLRDANLSGANLSGANLSGANLSSADLYFANITGANFIDANLNGIFLDDVKNLTNFPIKSACFWNEAIYQGHWDNKKQKWIADNKANQQYIEQLKKDKSSDHETPPDCSNWK